MNTRTKAVATQLVGPVAVLMLSALLPASAQQAADSSNAGTAPYPFVIASRVAGGPPIQRLKTTSTANGVAVADRIIVAFKSGLTEGELSQIHQQAAALGAGAAEAVRPLHDGFYLVDVTGAASLEAAAQAYRAADPRVVTAGPDFISTADTTPSDPLAATQLHLTRIQANAAWDRARGTGVTIAIVDSGIDATHPDLAGKIDDQVTMLGAGTSLLDDTGHGTGMAGIAAAATDNMIGIAGVGYDARLLNVKVASADEYPDSAVAEGIRWAADHGAHVINMSFSDARDCASSEAGVVIRRQAIEYAWSRNVVLVASAGNDHSTQKHTPASCPHVLSVAFTDHNDVVDIDSTRGSWVSVAAPGSNLVSTRANVPLDACSAIADADPRYGYCDGTSPAAAVVSGIAALVRATCTVWNQGIVDRITSTADRIAGTGSNWQFGRVNAGSAVCIPQPVLTQTGSTPDSLSYAWNDRSLETSFEFWFRPYAVNAGWSVVSKTANVTQHTVAGLQMGVWYEAMVRACDPAGCSEFSSTLVKKVNYFQLNITRLGGGSVKSTPAGIDCRPRSTKCAAVFQANTDIWLDAIGGLDPITRRNYDFDHWEGACSGPFQSCLLRVNDPQPTQAVAVFVFSGNQ